MNFFKNRFLSREDKLSISKITKAIKNNYKDSTDPWGLSLESLKSSLKMLLPLYKKYFRVRVFGAENISNSQYMVVSNHSGQIAIDGALITLAFALEGKSGKLLRGMVDETVISIPFLGSFFSSVGAVLGSRTNCEYLLKKGENVLVFPEGIRGVAKESKDFYELQRFTRGFFRMALKEGVDILPVAVVGAEEFYPLVTHPKTIKDFFNIPAFPITPTFPFLGPLGGIPLPSPVDIYIGKPQKVPKRMSPDAMDSIVNKQVDSIRLKINKMLKTGLKERRESELFNKLGIKLKREI